MENYDKLGSPDVRLGPLKIWVHGFEYADNFDAFDGDWLRASVHCGGKGAQVFVTGSILRLSELLEWLKQLEAMNSNLSGCANLDCIEPELKVEMQSESLGHISTKVMITPDHLTQFHSFEFDLDQSYLSPLIAEIKKIRDGSKSIRK